MVRSENVLLFCWIFTVHVYAAEFQPLLDAEKTEDLRRMYELSTRIADGLVPLRELLEKHVTQQGLAAVERIEEPANPDVKVCSEPC